MLGIVYTQIECNKTTCKYNTGHGGGVCKPPLTGFNENEQIKIKNGKCITYTTIKSEYNSIGRVLPHQAENLGSKHSTR